MLDLGRSFVASVERCPDQIAIVDGELRLTYGQWFERVRNVAGGLHAMGLGHGDHLLTVLQNSWEMATLHWACQFLGAVMTPLNWRAKPEELDYCASNSEAALIVFQDVSAQTVANSAVAQRLPRVAVQSAPDGVQSFEAMLESKPTERLLNADASDWSLLLFTSGTTGMPKGVPRRHCHERAAALAHVAQNLYRVGERTLGVMPLYHTMGVRSLLSMALINGRFVCIRRFNAAEALRVIAAEAITNLYLVPTLYHDLAECQDSLRADISSVRKLGFAGAPMNEGLLKRLDLMFKPELFVNHYGSSEVYTYTIEPNARSKPGSAGKSGINQRIRVVKLNAEDANDMAADGEEGQIVADLHGDEAFEGYWKRTDADAKALHGDWYFTGDLGYFDEQGDLFVTGRIDDMIISGGENISPTDIESLLSLHPAVDEVAVVGLPDERWGQKVSAFVKLKNDVDAAELDKYCRQSSLPDFKRPREYVFVSGLPKSPVGKILRRKIVAGEYER
ncbi:MAG TPA: AMP-binding protein [Paralcaligenes sp.]